MRLDDRIAALVAAAATVSGLVDLPYQRTCAESDAKSVPGVIGVTNLIRLAAAQAAQRQH